MRKILTTTDLIFTGLIGLLSIFLLILLPIDAIEFYNNPSDYIKVYDLDTSEKFWRLEYLKNSILFVVLSLAVLITIGFSIKKKNNKILIIRRVVVYSLILLMVIAFTKWGLNGFDH
ncbi:hypothetical protein [Saccharicrinis sp. FJH54]|uniref:hypothetical protein n=1 Tax=Saccharicrinis sp. FJH54 TaxID=3344665 RepID=UPI0035D495BB